MDSFTAFLAKLLRPILSPISRWLLSSKRSRPTWHYETAVVIVVLAVVAFSTSPTLQEVEEGKVVSFLIVWLSAVAVLGSFLHAKVGYRMAEVLKETNAPTTSCYEWSGKYWLFKETLWFFVFLLSGAYPAIAGSVIFILYPSWRKIHTKERKKLRG